MRVETFISKYSKSSPTKVTFGIIKIIFLADPPTCRSPVGNPLPPSAMSALAVSVKPRTHPDRSTHRGLLVLVIYTGNSASAELN